MFLLSLLLPFYYVHPSTKAQRTLDDQPLLLQTYLMDFVSDFNPTGLYRTFSAVAAPSFVEDADVLTPEYVSTLHKTAFADPSKREFPCHTKAASWLSAAYFFGSGLTNPPVEENIKSACKIHGVDIEEIVAQKELILKEASETPEFKTHALEVDFEGEDGRGVERYYSIKIASQVEDSARNLLNDFDAGKLPEDWFVRASREIVKAASVTGLPKERLHARIKAAGVDRVFDLDTALRMAETRAWAGVPFEGVELYKAAALGASEDPGNEDRWMTIWGDLDRTNLVKYSRTVLEPHRAFYAGPETAQIEKMAREVVVLEDVIIPKAVVTKPSEDSIRQRFNKQAAEVLLGMQKKACSDPFEASRLFHGLDKGDRSEFMKLLLEA